VIDAGLVPAEPGAARRELRRSTLRPARPRALGGVVIVVNQQRGAGRHLETAATVRTGLRVAAALYAVHAVASRLGQGLIGLLTAGDSRTADIVYSAGIIRVGGLPARAYDDPDALYWTSAACNVAGVVETAAAVRFVGRVGRAAPT
jgi:hypothetical protein